MSTEKRRIEFGWQSPPLSQQLAGLLPRNELKILDGCAAAILMLYLDDILSEKQHVIACQKLIRRIQQRLHREAKRRKGKGGQ